MKKLILTCLMALVVTSAMAAQVEVSFISGLRAPTNDDGSPYTDPKAFRWQCGAAAGGPYTIEVDTPDGSMTAPPGGDPNALGTTIGTVLGGESDGNYFCVVRDVNQSNLTSNASNESEAIIKSGSNFFVTRAAPTAPSAPILN